MIFVTVGTERFPFDRLIKFLDHKVAAGIITDEVFGQIGYSGYVPRTFVYSRFLTFGEMIAHISSADIVVAHAGVGTTLLCLSLDKIPIILPRQKAMSEHLDNHQIEFSRQMEKERKVIVAHDEQHLLAAIKSYNRLKDDLKTKNVRSGKIDLMNYLGYIMKREA
jgi:UDP-N-acetylglucosamine transferase subunit ALG13